MSALTLWTALPNGIRRASADDDWTAHISIFVSPRLTPPGGQSTLRDFPALVDWPATLRSATPDGLQFDVQVSDGRSLTPPVAVRAVRPELPTSAAWRAIFAQDTPVRAQGNGPLTAGNTAPGQVQFYDGKSLAQQVRVAYQQALLQHSDGDNRLRATARTQAAGDRSNGDPLAPFRRRQTGRFGTAAVSNGDSVAQFLDFHRTTDTPSRTRKRGAADDDALDIHQIITVISAHGPLLRQLGLVIDLEVPLADLPTIADPSALTVRVVPRGLPDSVTWRSLRTAVELATAGSDTYRIFCPATEARRPTYGFYALNTPAFGVSQEQFETTTLSLLQHADGNGTSDAMPRLLQGGMRLLDTSIPSQIRSAMADTIELESALRTSPILGAAQASAQDDEPDTDTSMPVLYAEQLTRGYRIDVQDTATGTWRSLCERSNRYSAGTWQWPANGETIHDEGAVEFMTFTDEHDETGAQRALQDLFHWDGWSLALPRPGADTPSAAPTPLDINSQARAGSLQPQRFGASYRFRARNVDIAGNGLTLDDVAALDETLPLSQLTSTANRFTRVESLLPPIVFPAQEPDVEDTGDVLIIRDAEDAAFRKTTASAHLFPPGTSIDMAERHGLFDALDADAAWDLLQRHQGRLDTDADGHERRFLPARPAPAPYLPDPLAHHAMIRLPGASAAVVMPAFGAGAAAVSDRPLAESCLLTIKPGKNDLRHTVRERQCVIDVPKGRSLTLTLACRPSAGALHTLAMADPDWLDVDASKDDVEQMLLGALDAGTAELIAPTRTLQIVHASQRPLITPVFNNPNVAVRARNDTHAVLYDPKLLIDTGSTGRIDLYARWQDIEDRPQTRGWTTLDLNGHVGGVDLTDDGTPPFIEWPADSDARPPLRYEFGDTKHHAITLQAVAISRFVDLYPPALTQDIDNMSRRSATVTLHVPASAPPPPPDIAYVMPTFRHTSETPEPYVARAAQHGDGLRIYLQRGWFASGIDEQLALVFADAPYADNARDDVSVWGVNTLHHTADLPGQLLAEHVTSGGDPVMHVDESDRATLRIPHAVQFSAEHNRTFVNVEFVPQLTFMPLVRLVVARYQPYAIDGCHHSPTTTTDFVPLAPGRHVTVQKAAALRWSIDMRGGGASSPDGGSDALVVEAIIEGLPKNTPHDSAAWIAIGPAVTLSASQVDAFSFQWTGDVLQQETSGIGHKRLVIREYETLEHGSLPPDASLADYARPVSVHTIAL
ncbi:MAG: hypothetical protein AAFO81_10610 [Pseudomonadota bacterium]